MRTLNAICVGAVIGALAVTWFFSWSFEPVIEKATHGISQCPTGCRTDADITCEKFRDLIRAPHRVGIYPTGGE